MICKNWDKEKTKECKNCHKFLPLTEEFWRTSDVRLLYCLKCREDVSKQIDKKYKNSHKELNLRRSRNWRSQNRDKVIESKRKYRKNNPDKVKAEKQRHFSKPENKEKKKQHDKIYYENNKEKIRKRQYKWAMSKTEVKLKMKVSHMINMALKSNNSSKNGGRSFNYLDYSVEELKEFIQSKFEPWMNWDNWGPYKKKDWDDNDISTWKWQIDHIIPQSKLPYTSMGDENFKKCWALENLRPLSAKENILKGNREIIDENTSNC
jgi:hypothetical protein